MDSAHLTYKQMRSTRAKAKGTCANILRPLRGEWLRAVFMPFQNTSGSWVAGTTRVGHYGHRGSALSAGALQAEEKRFMGRAVQQGTTSFTPETFENKYFMKPMRHAFQEGPVKNCWIFAPATLLAGFNPNAGPNGPRDACWHSRRRGLRGRPPGAFPSPACPSPACPWPRPVRT